jgi:hypothetical protein
VARAPQVARDRLALKEILARQEAPVLLEALVRLVASLLLDRRDLQEVLPLQ